VSQAASFVKDNLSGDVWRVAGQTLYSRLGSWPILLGSVMLVMLGWRRKSSSLEN